MKTVYLNLLLLVFGGGVYGVIELIWRGRTHWTMVLLGGVCFLILYNLYARFPTMSLPEYCVFGSLIITSLEYVMGCVVNLYFDWNVWDYSDLPLNIMGQVCLLYSVYWGLLCVPMNYIFRLISGYLKPLMNVNKA